MLYYQVLRVNKMSTDLARIRLVKQIVKEAEASDKCSGEYRNVDREALAALRERRAQKAAAEQEAPARAGEYCITYGLPAEDIYHL